MSKIQTFYRLINGNCNTHDYCVLRPYFAMHSTAQFLLYLYSFLICDIMFYIVKSPWHIFVGQAKTYGADWHTIF